jgi:hypothetical protein
MPALISSVNSLNIYRNEKCFQQNDKETDLIGFAPNDLLDNSTEVILMSIIVQQDATSYSFYSLQTALHVSGDNFTHHQERE